MCPASGGPWGGTAVDQQFIQLLTKIVGGPVLHKFQKESTYEYHDMMREFEVTKRRVHAGVTKGQTKGKATTNIKIPVTLRTFCEKLNEESLESILTSENFPYKSQIRIIADKFLIDKDIMQGLFMKVINPITDHVQTILGTKEAKDVSIIILAGGVAESPWVQVAFQEKFKTKKRRVIVSEEAGLSVLKGAVMFGHRPDNIKARRLRYTYGAAIQREFVEKLHPQSKKKTVENKDYCEGIFGVFITKGTLVEQGFKIKESYTFQRSQKDKIFAIYCSSNTKNPSYIDDKGCKLISEINMNPLLPATKKENYNLQVTYIFGDTEVEMEIRGKNFGFVYNDKFDYKDN